MHGVITTREVIANLRLIWLEFGPAILLRCLVAMVSRKPSTFLEVAFRGLR